MNNSNSKKPTTNWDQIKQWTSARVGLGRTGHSLTTQAVLDFQRAHAEARNSVLQSWDDSALIKKLKNLNYEPIVVSTQALDRETYLKFPNKGRRLSLESGAKLADLASSPSLANFASLATGSEAPSIAFIVSDGLSCMAIENHFINLWQELMKNSTDNFEKTFPKFKIHLVIAPFGRVALSDDIGQILKAQMSVIFIGERPGLNSADSLGIYLTYDPKLGNTDANRNCISNVRPPAGLSYALAAAKLNYLMQESLKRQISGVELKEESLPLIQNKIDYPTRP